VVRTFFSAFFSPASCMTLFSACPPPLFLRIVPQARAVFFFDESLSLLFLPSVKDLFTLLQSLFGRRFDASSFPTSHFLSPPTAKAFSLSLVSLRRFAPRDFYRDFPRCLKLRSSFLVSRGRSSGRMALFRVSAVEGLTAFVFPLAQKFLLPDPAGLCQ